MDVTLAVMPSNSTHSILAQLDPAINVNVTISLNTTSSAMELATAIVGLDLASGINRELAAAGVNLKVTKALVTRVVGKEITLGTFLSNWNCTALT